MFFFLPSIFVSVVSTIALQRDSQDPVALFCTFSYINTQATSAASKLAVVLFHSLPVVLFKSVFGLLGGAGKKANMFYHL